jgi:hypothetical protein
MPRSPSFRPLALAAVAAVAGSALAVDTSTPSPARPPSPPSSGTGAGDGRTTHSWELPAITVQGQPAAELREEDAVGAYGQPRWTARRRFTEVRTYVIPQGQIQFEYWMVMTDKRHDEPSTIEHVYEVEIGLPYRFQLDLYQVFEKEGTNGKQESAETKVELRYALADYGKIWGNPTLYLEWANKSGTPDFLEGKLLLNGQIAPRWHWGANAVYEAQMGGKNGDGEINRELKAAISYTVFDEKLSIGAETKVAWSDTEATRGDYTHEILLGPSIQWRPLPQMHFDVSVLFGLNDDSPVSKTAFIAGWEF